MPAFKPLKSIATESEVKQEVKQEGTRGCKASANVSRFVRYARLSANLFQRFGKVKTEEVNEGGSQVKEEPGVKREPVSRVASHHTQVRWSPLYVVEAYR